MIKQKIKDRLEQLKYDKLVTESLLVSPSMSQHDKDVMIANVGSEILALEMVLKWTEDESGSTDGMRSKEEIEKHLGDLYIEKQADDVFGDSNCQHEIDLCIREIKWVLNEQEGKQ
jgi:hypothetical protein